MTTWLFHSITTNRELAITDANYATPLQVKQALARGRVTFDGPYKSVWQYRKLLRDQDVTVFVLGGSVGSDNTFDIGQPYDEFCSWDEIMNLREEFGITIGWHTRTHPDLRTLSDGDLAREITPPFPMTAIAYPYGHFDARVVRACERAGFLYGYGVTDGCDGSSMRLARQYFRTMSTGEALT